jgi:ABC-type multidrug transport system permease subunit
MNHLVLAARESGNVLRSFWRNRTGAFFTILIAVEAVLVLGMGRLLFGVSLPPSPSAWATFALVVLLGAATFTAVGIAYTRLVANADSAPALVQAAFLPLLFLSGAWFPLSGLPHWLVVSLRTFRWERAA